MTYAVARARVVEIVKTATPSTKEKGLGPGFVHDPMGQKDKASGARRFWLRGLAGAGVAPASFSINRVVVELELVIDYASSIDAAAFDAAIVDDWRVVATALGDARLWQGASSGIIHLGGGDGDRLFPFTIDDVEGGRRLRVRFLLQIKVLP